MKRALMKLLTLVLVLMLCAAAAALAEGEVAKIGETLYETLAAAVAAAQSGDTIVLIADDHVSFANGAEVEINKALTITGEVGSNGAPLYTIYGTSDQAGANDIFITGSGDVTLSNLNIREFGNRHATDIGHAPIYVSKSYSGTVKLVNLDIREFNRGGIFLYGGAFVVDDCYIDCANSYSGAFTKGIEIKLGANGTVKDTVITNMERASTTYSPAGIEIYGSGDIVVDSCSIISDNGTHASVKPTFGIVTNRTGTPDANSAGLQVKGTLIDVTNAALSLEDESAFETTVDDCVFTNYIATWSDSSKITINSGEYAEDVYADAGTIEIKGGTFTNFAPDSGTGSIIISGGTFDAPVPEEYCAEGFIPRYNEATGEYEVGEGTFVAHVEGTGYETFAEAVEAANNGEYVIELDEKITEAYTMSSVEEILKVRKNGKSLTVKAPAGAYVVSSATADGVTTYTVTDATFEITKADGTVSYSNSFSLLQSNGSTVKLLKDYTETSCPNCGSTMYRNISVTLDLNGHTLNVNSTTNNRDYCLLVTKNNTLTIKNGTIEMAPTARSNGILVQEGSTLNIEASATIKAHNGVSAVTVVGDVTLNTAGVLSAENSFVIAGNGTEGKGGYTINVTGGTVTSTNAPAIYHPNAGTLNISGGTITGATAVYQKAGELNISGGTLRGTGSAAGYTYNGNGANATGDAVVIDNCGYPGGAPEPSITGGVFESVNAQAVGSYSYGEGHEPETGFVEGGTFSTEVPKAYCVPSLICATKMGEDDMYHLVPRRTVYFAAGNGAFEDGNKLYSVDVPDNEALDLAEVPGPVCEGYTFKEWQLKGEAYDFETPVTATIVLTAEYDINTYKVTFNTAIEGADPIVKDNVEHFKTLGEIKPADPERENYVFQGWHKISGEDPETPDLVKVPDDEVITDEITFFAVWKGADQVIMFTDGMGNSLSIHNVPYGTVLNKADFDALVYGLTAEKKADLVAAKGEGWTLDDEDLWTPALPTEAQIEVKDPRVYALKWIKLHKVSFVTGCDATVEAQFVKDGEKATEPDATTLALEGHTFDDWYIGANAYDFDAAVTADLTLIARWEKNKYEVTFDADGGEPAPAKQTIEHGEKAVEPDEPEKEGWTFAGWTLDGEAYDFGTPVTGAIGLKATWTKNTYDVTFDADGGTPAPAKQTIDHGEKADEPDDPEKEGFDFKGWKLNDADYDFDTAVTGAIELKAAWEKKQYQVTFDADGGAPAPEAQTIEHGGKAVKPADPEKLTFSFDGWFTDGATDAFDFTTPIKDNVALKAHWTAHTLTAEAEQANFIISIGDSVTLKVNAQAAPETGKLRYRWYRNDETSYVVTSGNTYELPPIRTDTTYRCEVSDDHDNTVVVTFTIRMSVDELVLRVGQSVELPFGSSAGAVGTGVTVNGLVVTAGNNANSSTKLNVYDEEGNTIAHYSVEVVKAMGVRLPDEVTTIGARAFAKIPATFVTLGEKVQTVGENAFEGSVMRQLTVLSNIDLANVAVSDKLMTIVCNRGNNKAIEFAEANGLTWVYAK